MRSLCSTKILLSLLLAACIARLWLMPLPSSFWVDEMVTAFVIHYGAAHPSLAVAPQVTATVYYWLPRTAESLFGFSEIVYRVPSLLALGAALWLIGLLAARLIHREAAWPEPAPPRGSGPRSRTRPPLPIESSKHPPWSADGGGLGVPTWDG